MVTAGRDGNGQWGGRDTGITLTGSAGSVRVSGDAFRAGLMFALQRGMDLPTCWRRRTMRRRRAGG